MKLKLSKMRKRIEYKFINELNSNIIISIMAYSLYEAEEMLIFVVKNLHDYKPFKS